MRKTVLILAALAAFICRAEPDDAATEAYAHFEATNEVAKVMEQIDLWKAELGTTNYAPKSWVLSLDYTTLGAVQAYLASMDYASKGHVSDNYVSKEQLNAADYAQKTWVDSYVAEIRKHSLGGIWDAGLEVWWTPVMTNGCLIYKATTNVNMNAEVTP